jgi:hypothetical protein
MSCPLDTGIGSAEQESRLNEAAFLMNNEATYSPRFQFIRSPSVVVEPDEDGCL